MSPCHRVIVGLVLAAVGGCASETTTGTVTGDVTLDGQPLKEGIIRFLPADGQSPTASATIADARFRATVPLGAMRVEISAPKIVGKRKMYDTPGSPVVDVVAELIPARYNVRSELTMIVQKGAQEKRFELKSK